MKFSWNCEIRLKLWNSVEVVKFSWNCELRLKLWTSVEIMKFSWSCEIQLNLWNSVKWWNSVQRVKFSWNGEIRSKFWNYTILDQFQFSIPGFRPVSASVAWFFETIVSVFRRFMPNLSLGDYLDILISDCVAETWSSSISRWDGQEIFLSYSLHSQVQFGLDITTKGG